VESPQTPPLPPVPTEEKKPQRQRAKGKVEKLTPVGMRQAIFESVMQEQDATIAAAVLEVPGFAVRHPYGCGCALA